MLRMIRLALLGGPAAVVVLGGMWGAGPARGQEDKRKVIIPFDFVSKFDDGRYGGMVGEGIFKKLAPDRQQKFLIPEGMSDIRDLVANHKYSITPDTPLETMKKIVKEDFDASIGIWGSVERVAGFDADVYDLVIKCVDFDADPPRVIYECAKRTNSVSEIPDLYEKQMFDILLERSPDQPEGSDPAAEERWKNNPNLVTGGDFERGRGGVPVGWESTAGQMREPLGHMAKWTGEKGNPRNKVLRMDIPKDVAESFGVMFYSRPFKVEEGAKYRFQCRYRTDGPSPKVFIKCYDYVETQYKREGQYASSGSKARATTKGKGKAAKSDDSDAGDAGPTPSGGPGGGLLDPEVSAGARECYRSQQNLKGPKDQWNTQTQDFTPKHTKYSPQVGRVMLYGYLKEGSIEWDDVVIKQIVPPTGKEKDKIKRHSLETKVTIKEMEENERRSDEAKRKARAERAEKAQKPDSSQ